MHILQRVIVKQVLTEKSKQELYERFIERKTQLEKEITQLMFQMKQTEKAHHSSSLLRAQFEKEKENRLEKIRVLDFQIEQLGKLTLGSELVEKEVEGLIEVNVGDDWSQLQQAKTIVLKDGIVIDIR
ncbi:YlqD family protein [Bacillus sp. CGMCC 1.16541]|uniref:YlqD family protein n=1 Tax=Bacillus sp. CGMCC 1.16541 TaxID=2185143 RepID=UPI000D72FC36|nr:YlqD family protein [Bacillus sp. CGMCC 1.16541]